MYRGQGKLWICITGAVNKTGGSDDQNNKNNTKEVVNHAPY